MGLIRLVGIDFGTSTSLIKVKTYQDQTSLGSKEAIEYVRFNNQTTVPSLIYQTLEGTYLVGYEAQCATLKGNLHQNFKLDLISDDLDVRERAFFFTQLLFDAMYKAYSEQCEHFPYCDEEITYVSHPAKWPDELHRKMVSIAQKAGFRNVKTMDEPTAAIHAIMVQQNEKLQLSGQDFLNILMIDMGAGTTDLVLCRYSPFEEKQISLLSTWPKSGDTCLFGGSEIDLALCGYLKDFLSGCGISNLKNFQERHLDACKAWKEANVSPTLRDKNGTVTYCGFVDALLTMMDVDQPLPPITRNTLEELLAHYLNQFPQLVMGCLADADFKPAELDYVILTGGHSQWYFAQEILQGTMTRFGALDLPKIKEDASRIIKPSLPQETVAIGLVLQRIEIERRDRPSIYVTGLINMLLERCAGACGNSLLNDEIALKRLEAAAREGVAVLTAKPETPIDIPYLSANANGPVHMHETVTRQELDRFVQRYNVHHEQKAEPAPDTLTMSIAEVKTHPVPNPKDSDKPHYCPKCGSAIKKDASYCGRCGQMLQKPKPVCTKCGQQMSELAVACPNCREHMTKNLQMPSQKTLAVVRENQLLFVAVFYKVIVNGVDYGDIASGSTMQIKIADPVIVVEIQGDMFTYKNQRVRYKLKVADNPTVSFKLQYPGVIIPSVSGATILEQS
jgi:molecular chaperone DnaK (HSP70)/predicted nucleic acid-binding Zn ribbon protein